MNFVTGACDDYKNPAKRWEVLGNTPNKGRWFLKCYYFRNRCFYMWEDDAEKVPGYDPSNQPPGRGQQPDSTQPRITPYLTPHTGGRHIDRTMIKEEGAARDSSPTPGPRNRPPPLNVSSSQESTSGGGESSAGEASRTPGSKSKGKRKRVVYPNRGAGASEGEWYEDDEFMAQNREELGEMTDRSTGGRKRHQSPPGPDLVEGEDPTRRKLFTKNVGFRDTPEVYEDMRELSNSLEASATISGDTQGEASTSAATVSSAFSATLSRDLTQQVMSLLEGKVDEKLDKRTLKKVRDLMEKNARETRYLIMRFESGLKMRETKIKRMEDEIKMQKGGLEREKTYSGELEAALERAESQVAEFHNTQMDTS